MKPFEPDKLPLNSIDWALLVPLIGDANAALARYDGMMQTIPNRRLLLSPLTVREAVLSSRIEGTQSTIEEVMRIEADPTERMESSRGDEIQEVVNYRIAMGEAVHLLEKYPVCHRVLKSLHKILFDSVRGRDKSPGEFRKDQNWIGPKGSPIEKATFIPPTPDQMVVALDNWEKYCHFNEKDRLVQLAIVKAQFEIIHPFNDGNGRIGRMLVPLFLFEKGLLGEPMLYISEYFENHDDEYRSCLNAISSQNDWNGWITFFLTAVLDQAKANTDKVKGILDLYGGMKNRVGSATRSQFAMHLLDAIFSRPVFRRSGFSRTAQIPNRQTADYLLKLLIKDGVLKVLEPGSGRKSALLCFPDLINLVEGREVV